MAIVANLTTVQATIPIDSTSSSFWMSLTSTTGAGPMQGCIVKIVGYYY